MRRILLVAALLSSSPALAQVEYEPGPIWSRFLPRWMRGTVVAQYVATGCSGTLAALKGQPVTVTRASTEGGACSNGTWVSVGNNALVVTDLGAAVYGANSNAVASPEDASTWTDSGTPTYSADTWTTPWGTLTGDTIGDDDAGLNESKRVANITSSMTGAWTVSCWMKAGTSSAARLEISTNGTGSNACVISLTATATRYSCSATVGGSPTYVRPFVVPSNGTVTETGNVLVTGCQFEPYAVAGPYIPSATSRAATRVSVPNPIGTTPLPICFGGTYTSPWGAAYRYLAITTSGLNGLRIQYSDNQILQVITDDAGNASKTFAAAAASNFAANSTHTISGCYNPGSHTASLAVDGAAIAMAAPAGAGVAPSLYGATVYTGSNSAGSNSLAGYVSRFKICRGADPLRCQ